MPRTSTKRRRHSAPARDLFQETTDLIASALEKGVAPWVCPWKGGGTGLPKNGYTGRAYQGSNIFLLWATAIVRGYASADFYTFHQAKLATGYRFEKEPGQRRGRYVWSGEGEDPGYGVRKNEQGSVVLHWNVVHTDGKDEIVDGQTGEVLQTAEEGRIFKRPKHHIVFNRDQIDGLPTMPLELEPTSWERDQRAEAFVQQTGAVIHERGTRAFYSATTGEITMPSRNRFDAAGNWYSTLLHELGHWTAPRLDPPRELKATFGSEAYAEEELVAELTAAFCAAHLALPGTLGHPEYIGAWLARLKGDKHFFFRAAAQARRAALFLGARPTEEHEDSSSEPSYDAAA